MVLKQNASSPIDTYIPEYIDEYGSSTGVICFSKLISIFPQYDLNMLFSWDGILTVLPIFLVF